MQNLTNIIILKNDTDDVHNNIMSIIIYLIYSYKHKKQFIKEICKSSKFIIMNNIDHKIFFLY